MASALRAPLVTPEGCAQTDDAEGGFYPVSWEPATQHFRLWHFSDVAVLAGDICCWSQSGPRQVEIESADAAKPS
jgi:hypothetical protein